MSKIFPNLAKKWITSEQMVCTNYDYISYVALNDAVAELLLRGGTLMIVDNPKSKLN